MYFPHFTFLFDFKIKYKNLFTIYIILLTLEFISM
jgi:hypothetical protein